MTPVSCFFFNETMTETCSIINCFSKYLIVILINCCFFYPCSFFPRGLWMSEFSVPYAETLLISVRDKASIEHFLNQL